MTTAIVKSGEPGVSLAGVGARALEVIALDQPGLEASHAKMIEWSLSAQRQVSLELEEERSSLEIASKRKWATKPFAARISRLEKRTEFYRKIELALRAGYVLVPNFEMTAFAIRTDAKTPRGGTRSGRWNNFVQSAKLLPAGEGRYIDPNPFIETNTDIVPDGKGGTKEVVTQRPTNLDDEISFPLAIARPMLMTRAGEAMALKIFDEVGVAVDTRRRGGRGDPILMGYIGNPRDSRPGVSFFLGWSFDPSVL